MEKKKIIKFFIESIVLTIICVLVSYLVIKDSFIDVMKLIGNLNAFNVFALVMVVIFLVACNGFILKIVASNFNKKFTIKDGAQCSLIGSLFSGITPFRAGYHFGMLYSYNKKNIKVRDGVVISYIEGTAYQFVITILCLVLSIYISFNPVQINISGSEMNINLIIYIVSSINLIASLGLILIVKFKKIHELIVKLCLKFSKIFLKKRNINQIEIKVRESLTTIVNNSALLFEKKWQTVKIMLINFIRLIVIYSLPYIIYLFLSKGNFALSEYFICLAYAMVITFCLWIVPIPGGAGASEMLFYLLYSLVITNETMIRASVLVWRFFTYYVNLILGMIVLLIIKNKDIIKETREMKSISSTQNNEE